jgi:transketolase
MRTAFIQGLIELARRDDRVVLVVGDLGYSVIEPFEAEFPTRFFNAGIAEQSMMGLAAGLASEGYRVFAYSIANFPTFRCAEQIRNDIAHHNLSVTIVSVGGGLVYGNMGYSHHAIQDYALMRIMPGMTILAPGDDAEVALCLDMASRASGPSYLRLGNPQSPVIHQNSLREPEEGWIHVAGDRDSKNVLLSTGGTLSLAKSWLDLDQYRGFALYSVPRWGMGYRQDHVERIRQRDVVISVEDHLLDGGFGSWILESLSSVDPLLCSRLQIKALSSEVTAHVANEQALRALGGLVP